MASPNPPTPQQQQLLDATASLLSRSDTEMPASQLLQQIYRSLASVDGLRSDLSGLRSDLSGRMQALEQKIEAHVTYREFAAATQTSKDSIASLSERITAMEEWRISEINRRTEQLQQIQQQVGQVNTNVAQSEMRTATTTTNHVIELDRTAIRAFITVLAAILSALIAHAFWH